MPRKALHIVLLDAASGVTPEDLQNVQRNDTVEWQNDDAQDHTLTFTAWPFREKSAGGNTIVATAGQTTAPFTCHKQGIYTYSLAPTLPASGPPDGPSIIID